MQPNWKWWKIADATTSFLETIAQVMQEHPIRKSETSYEQSIDVLYT